MAELVAARTEENEIRRIVIAVRRLQLAPIVMNMAAVAYINATPLTQPLLRPYNEEPHVSRWTEQLLDPLTRNPCQLRDPRIAPALKPQRE